MKWDIVADIDGQVTPLDTDIVQRFAKTLLSGTTYKNLEVIQGKFTPNDNSKTIRQWDSADAPRFFAFFSDKAIALRLHLDGNSVNETIYNHLIPDGGFMIFTTKARATAPVAEYVYQAKLFAPINAFANPADIAQGVELNYTLITAELV